MNAPNLLTMIFTSDLAATRAFYVGKLDCKVSIETEHYLQVQFGDHEGAPQLAFMNPDAPSPNGPHKPFTGDGLTVSIAADDVDGRHQELAAREVPITDPPSDRPWGWRSFVARDPNGVYLDFFRPLADSAGASAAS